MFDDKELFVAHLEKLGLRALPAAGASDEERQ
jgi:hypothetical protein